MADAFSQFDTKSLLWSKHILFLGDSNIRAQYKDMVWLLNSNTLIQYSKLKSRLEESYLGDKLIQGSKLHRGRNFQEVRRYIDANNKTTLDFMFISRCYNSHIEELFCSIGDGTRSAPNVIVINSCLWDINRWGPNGVPEYKDNMVRLMRLMSRNLPKDCLVIWTTALPIAPHVQGGLIIKQIEFMEPLLRFEVMEANTFARELVVSHGFDVLDNHYHTRMQMHRRAKDGIHYLPIPVRLMTNLLLTHIALSWGIELPGNIRSVLLDKAIAMDCKPSRQTPLKVPNYKILSQFNKHSPTRQNTRGLKITFETSEDKCTSRVCSYSQEGLEQLDSKRKYVYPSQKARYQQISEGCSGISQNSQSTSQREQLLNRETQTRPEHSVGPFRRNKRKRSKRKNPYYSKYNHRY
ncbi:PC-esterase domain-containing protein 1A-like [Homalodisca vitripennis]|uniref:PC-esterase domain-containing protein 1A-like n=1 Tax=Homalodisca vitripennis TaxID=197043 RepID=UPI001EEB51E4|nr:PC-esterase domain-containing protein 1A-like [Homalodisca vitripennis]